VIIIIVIIVVVMIVVVMIVVVLIIVVIVAIVATAIDAGGGALGIPVATSADMDGLVVVESTTLDPDIIAFASCVVASTATVLSTAVLLAPATTVVVGPTGSPASEPNALVTPTPPTRTNPMVMATERLIMVASLAELTLPGPRKSSRNNGQETCKKRVLTCLFQARRTLIRCPITTNRPNPAS
jgi:hypothetical protein